MGPLPYLHRVAVVVSVLVTAIGSGAWVAHFTPQPVAATAGALVGGLAGILVSYVLLHAAGRPQPARIDRRRG